MESFDLTRVSDRLAIAERVFSYPMKPHQRKHGPSGYASYESYRDWLRDDFSYRCVFSLVRETWPQTQFHIDHLVSQKDRPDLVCDYGNLILLAARLNLVKGKRRVPDPGKIVLGECLHVYASGDRVGEIEVRNDTGKWLVRVLRLDSEDATKMRRQWLAILRSLAQTDEVTFRQFVGFPANVPDLDLANAPRNYRQEGIAQSAFQSRKNGVLPTWY